MSVPEPAARLSEDALFGGRVRLRQPGDGYRVAIDPVLLAAAVPADASDSVLDIGCGVGRGDRCACRRACRTAASPASSAQRDLVRLAGDNIVLNGWRARVSAMTGDLLRPPPRLEPGTFDACHGQSALSWKRGRATPSPDPGKAQARIEGEADLAAWVRFALAMVRAKGTITLHPSRRPDRAAAGAARRARRRDRGLSALARRRAAGQPHHRARAQAGADAGAARRRAWCCTKPTAATRPPPRRCCAMPRRSRWMTRPPVPISLRHEPRRSPPPSARALARPGPVVAVLRLEGVIGRGRGAARFDLRRYAAASERAFRHSAPEGAWRSPSIRRAASPAQSPLLYRRMRQLADEQGVPVFAFAEDVAASGGYWLALAADEIYAEETSLVGSIGVVSAGFGFAQVIEPLRHRAPALYRGREQIDARPVPAGESRRRRAARRLAARHPRELQGAGAARAAAARSKGGDDVLLSAARCSPAGARSNWASSTASAICAA